MNKDTDMQLFSKEQAPRRKPNALMHVNDAGSGFIELKCSTCGYETGWIEETLTVTEYKRGLPCPVCNT